LFTYAYASLAIEGKSHVNEADALFKLALQLATVGVLAEKIKNQKRNLAAPAIRTNAQGLPRMGAVMDLSRPVDDIWNLE
jgi:hypothetical protein